MKRRLTILIPALVAVSGCIRPHYDRADVPVPPAYRGQPAGAADGPSLGELRWQDLIHDDALSSLIREALANNYDVRIAAARVLEARAQLVQARSQRLPSLDAQAGYNNLRTARDGSTSLPDGYPAESGYTRLAGTLSWELDFWGRIRNSSAAARAQLLAGVESQRTVMQGVVSELASNYYLLCDLDREKEITERAVRGRRDSLELVRLRVDNGYSTEMEARQAETLVKSAQAQLVEIELQIEQTENLLNLLAGRMPGPVQRGRSLMDAGMASLPPPGLPSALLERRPDLRQAEHELRGSQAELAVTKAAYFPSISLTASSGFESAALRNLFKSSNAMWFFGPPGSLPLFNAGRIRAKVRAADARREQAALRYQQTARQAFREVADSLAARRKLAELRAMQESLAASARAAVELADLRYRGGISDYLEYLDSERQLLDAELRLIQVRREELVSVVTLYRALGGGWQ